MKREVILLHMAVMLFGLAGVIGKFVSVPAIIVTLGRVFFSSLFLGFLLLFNKESIKLKRKDYKIIMVSSIVMAIHWFTFIQSIKLASVAVGTITFASFPLFVTFLEPIIYKEKIQLKNILMAVAIIIGVMIMVPEFSLNNNDTMSVVIGMVSSFSYAILCLFNRYLSNNYSSLVVCFYEQGLATIILLPAYFLVSFKISQIDLAAIIVMGVLCTAIGHSLYVSCLKKVTVTMAGIVSGMESVYSIIFAFVLLQERLAINEVFGAIIILMASLFTSLKKDIDG